VNDFPGCLAVYRAIMAVLGHELRFSESDKPCAGWQQSGQPRPLVVIAAPQDGRPAAPGEGHMVARLALSRAQIDATHAACVAAGGTNAGPPGLRPSTTQISTGHICVTPTAPRSGWPATPPMFRQTTE
jgi:lactoylglutathione lyase